MCLTKTWLNLCAPVRHWEQKLKKNSRTAPGGNQRPLRLSTKVVSGCLYNFFQTEHLEGACGGRKRPESKLFHLYQLKNVKTKSCFVSNLRLVFVKHWVTLLFIVSFHRNFIHSAAVITFYQQVRGPTVYLTAELPDKFNENNDAPGPFSWIWKILRKFCNFKKIL